MKLIKTPELLEAECIRLGFRPPLAKFSIDDVPENLREFVGYAQIWGHNSEETRYEIVQSTPPSLQYHVHQVVWEPAVQDRFDDWLAEPNALLTEAYLAYTCLRMSADEMG